MLFLELRNIVRTFDPFRVAFNYLFNFLLTFESFGFGRVPSVGDAPENDAGNPEGIEYL